MKSAPKKLVVLFALFFAIAFYFNAAAEEAPSFPAKASLDGMDASLGADIEKFITEKMEEFHSPGLAVGIVKDSKLIFSGYFGYADIASQKPVGERTLFRIGSISKTMTTIGLFQQWEEGKFNIDDDVNKYFSKPYFHPPHPDAKPITFRHLLTHTSGIGEFINYKQFTKKWLGMAVAGDNYLDIAHYLDYDVRTHVDPGVKWAYSNYGFGYVGLLLQSIAGEPFHIYQKENLFDKLGMKNTTFRHDDEVLKNLVTGYMYKETGFEAAPHRAYGVTSAGNVYSNVNDMALYMEALLNGGGNRYGEVIEPETLEMLMKTQYSLDSRQSGWGFGFEVYGNDLWGHRIVGHSGSVPFGYTALMLLVPDLKIGVIVLSNSWTYSPRPIGWGVLKKVLKVSDEAAQVVEPNLKVWRELTGYYGPEYKDFKTDMRLYMGGVGKYRIAIIDNRLVLIRTWKGKSSSQTLSQAGADDPYFYRIDDKESPTPEYIAFKKKENGAMYIIPGGLNEYKKMGVLKKCKTRVAAIPGRAIMHLIP